MLGEGAPIPGEVVNQKIKIENEDESEEGGTGQELDEINTGDQALTDGESSEGSQSQGGENSSGAQDASIPSQSQRQGAERQQTVSRPTRTETPKSTNGNGPALGNATKELTKALEDEFDITGLSK